MRIYIHYDFKNEPWGGGNQFLKALKDQWCRENIYAETAKDADGILFNSHHDLEGVIFMKRRYPYKIFIHRLDGIMTLTRNDYLLDRMIYHVSRFISDGIIFQSQWAQKAAYRAGCPQKKAGRVIVNASDPDIFNSLGKSEKHFPVRLVASSWSKNLRKGFLYLQWLDNNLDFSKYLMTFVGNSPITFQNIKHVAPRDSESLSQILKSHDIYIFAGQEDACPNGLVEALHCGLPAVFLKSGSNGEIVKKAGVSFNNNQELLDAIDRVAKDYLIYQSAISLSNICSIANQYYDFFEEIYQKNKNAKRLSEELFVMVQLKFIFLKMAHQFNYRWRKIMR